MLKAEVSYVMENHRAVDVADEQEAEWASQKCHNMLFHSVINSMQTFVVESLTQLHYRSHTNHY